MGYSWYRTDSAYHRHPKMLALKVELDEPLADAYVSRLWSWTQVYAPSGRFSAALIDGLESELGWTGSKGSLAAALEKTGWLERSGEAICVHDWPDFQGYLVKKSKKDADKKRKRRDRESARTAQSVRSDGAAPSPRTAPPTDVTDGRDGRDASSAPRDKRAAGDGFGPLVGRLKAAFADATGQAYEFSDADGGALKNLMKRADADEIERRFRVGLNAGQYDTKCATVLQLAQRWNELAVSRTTKPEPRDKPTAYETGYITP